MTGDSICRVGKNPRGISNRAPFVMYIVETRTENKEEDCMFNRKAAGKIAASAIAAAAVIVPSAAPLMAATIYDTSKQEFSGNLSAPKMNKYLLMKRDANVPNVTFNFTISTEGVTAQPATSSTLAVYPGNDTTKVDGTPVLSNNGAITFGPNDSVYTTYQSLGNDLGGIATGRTDVDMLGKGNYTGFTASGIDNTRQYAKKDIAIDFSAVKFKEPGVYRWKITETSTDADSFDVKDEDGKFLDVYVEHKDGTNDTLVVTGYVLHNEAVAPSINGGTPTPASNTKDGGFVNEYFTQDLTFGKQVTGNQGSKDKYFEFTLNLTGAAAGDVFKVDITDADGNIAANPNGATTVLSSAAVNPTSLTADNSGNVTQKFYLQADQSIVVKNLSKGMTYTLTENNEDYVKTEASASTPVAYNRAANTWKAGDISATDAAAGTIGTKDINTGFKNERKGTIPTGLAYTVFPGAVAVLLGGAGATFVMKKKREN